MAGLLNLAWKRVLMALAMAGAPRLAAGQVTAQNEGEGGWILQSARDDIIPGLQDLEMSTWGDRTYAESPRPERIRNAYIEIRTPDNSRRVAMIPGANISGLFSTGGTQSLGTFPLRKSASVPAGKYLTAWIVNDHRRSNVVGFTIDPDKDPAKLPFVRIVQIEPERAGELPAIGVYVTRAKASDPAPDFETLSAGTLAVDGVPLQRRGIFYSGPSGPLPVGVTCSTRLSFAAFESQPDPAKPHMISALIAEGPFSPEKTLGPINGVFHQSPAVALETGTPLGDAWDKATPDLAPAPATRISVAGKIEADPPPATTSRYGPTFQACQITLRDKDLCCREHNYQADFDFRNIPDGTYTLVCQPLGKTRPALTVEGVKIDSKAAPTLTLPFNTAFENSGTIVHADGAPAAGVPIACTWKSDDGRMTYEAVGETDAQGRYAMRAPFSKIASISYRDGESEVRVDGKQDGPLNGGKFKLSK